MKIGCLQFMPGLGNPERNIKRIEQFIKEKDFDLLVIPELANSGYLFSGINELEECSEEIPNGDFCRMLLRICSEKNAYIVSGICEKYEDKFYNSSILVYPSGEIKTYRKLHLFYEEKLWFTPGDLKLNVYEIEGVRFGKVNIGMMICYDWIYPETARTLALKGAQIICHPSNLVMPYCQDAMFTRALENHVFTITANRTGKDVNKNKELIFTGKSVILSPQGKYLYEGPGDGEECIVIGINPEEALNKDMNQYNSLFKDRREGFYD